MSVRVRAVLIPLVVFAAAAVVFSYPLVLHLGDRLPGQVAGDNLSFLWNLWWMRQAGTHFFTTPLLFAPFGIDLALHTHTGLQAAIAATLLRSIDVVTAQNLIILATLTANGWAAYLLALDRTGNRTASLVGGLVFATPAYVAAHLLGHFNLIGTWTLPLFVLCALRAVERQSIAWSALCGLSLLACAYTDYYYTVYCVVIATAIVLSSARPFVGVAVTRRGLPLGVAIAAGVLLAGIAASAIAISVSGGFDRTIAGVRIRATESTNLLSVWWVILAALVWARFRPRIVRADFAGAGAAIFARVKTLAPAACVALIGLLPVLVHVARLWHQGDYSAPPHLWRSGPSGVDLVTLVLGSPLHPLTGPLTTRAYDSFGIDPIEGVGWLGGAGTVALLWGAWRARHDAQMRRIVLGGAAFFVWALGPWLKVGGLNTGLLLPANVLGLVPILSNARMPGRAIVVTILAASLLVARLLADASPARRRGLAIAAVMLICVDLPAPYPLITMSTPPSMYARIATGDDGVVCELPMGLRDGFEEIGEFDDRTLQYQMVHGRPLVGGFAARIPASLKKRYEDAPVFRSLLRLSEPDVHDADPRDADLTAERAAAELRGAGVRYVVLDRSTASRELIAFVESKVPLTSVERDGDRELFVVGR